MPTVTPNYGFYKPLINNAIDADLWGALLNTNWDTLDSLLYTVFNGAFVTLTGVQTLTNKSLSDGTTFIIDETDATKKAQFQASGITTGTTRTYTLPDKNGTLATTSDIGGVTAQFTPSNPAGTTSTTGVMMGLGTSATITPSRSGKVLIIISGDLANSLGGGNQCRTQIRFGTGTAPSNGAALTGTAAGGLIVSHSSNNTYQSGFSLNAIVSGLSVGTSHWVDISLSAISGGTASAANLSISMVEV